MKLCTYVRFVCCVWWICMGTSLSPRSMNCFQQPGSGCCRCLRNVPETCQCISGTDLLIQFYVLPHWERSCRNMWVQLTRRADLTGQSACLKDSSSWYPVELHKQGRSLCMHIKHTQKGVGCIWEKEGRDGGSRGWGVGGEGRGRFHSMKLEIRTNSAFSINVFETQRQMGEHCFFGCLTSNNRQSVSQRLICPGKFTSITDTEIGDQTCHLIKPQYTDTGVCAHVCVCTCVCVCVHVCSFPSVPPSTHTCVYESVYVHVCVYAWVCVHVCVYVHTCPRMHAYMSK